MERAFQMQIDKKEQNNLPEVIATNHPIFNAFEEIIQPRTNYQIDKFVIGQHDTDEQKYKQILLEIKTLISALRRSYLSKEKLKLQYDQLVLDNDPIKEIDAELLKLEIDDLDYGIKGALKEFNYFMKLWDNCEHKYTAEEIEELQPMYWNKRLNRQASLEAIGSGGTINWASLDALNQIGNLPSLDPNFYLPSNLNDSSQGEIL